MTIRLRDFEGELSDAPDHVLYMALEADSRTFRRRPLWAHVRMAIEAELTARSAAKKRVA